MSQSGGSSSYIECFLVFWLKGSGKLKTNIKTKFEQITLKCVVVTYAQHTPHKSDVQMVNTHTSEDKAWHRTWHTSTLYFTVIYTSLRADTQILHDAARLSWARWSSMEGGGSEWRKQLPVQWEISSACSRFLY